MHSISGLRQTLGLTSANQVRNRIEAIKDLLIAHIRRGPNNQILLTDAGAELLRRLQELHDSGLTMKEASDVLRANIYKQVVTHTPVSQPMSANDAKPGETASRITALQQEIAFLRQRIAGLEQRLLSADEGGQEKTPWWYALREEIDAA